MIKIIQVGPYNQTDPMGERLYDIVIGAERIAQFKHVRGDGLAVCLRKAADAVDKARDERADKLLSQIMNVHRESTGISVQLRHSTDIVKAVADAHKKARKSKLKFGGKHAKDARYKKAAGA